MKVVLAAGGTAGHLFPAFQVGQDLKSQDHQVVMMGALTGAEQQITDLGFEYFLIESQGLQRQGVLKSICVLWISFVSLVKAWRILGRMKPDVVAGFGGYAAFSVVLAACLRGIPTLIHEQNVVPGRANQILARWVKRVAVSFAQSQDYFVRNKVVVTGCPVRVHSNLRLRREIFKHLNFTSDRQTILVFGGSQGSQQINEVFSQTLKALAEHNVQVIHISGKGKIAGLDRIYRSAGIPYFVSEYYSPLQELMSVSDLVVCRAGAGTILELVMYQCPAILIPYPYAGGHQKANAAVLAEKDLAVTILDGDLTADQLVAEIKATLRKTTDVDKFGGLLKDLKIPQASDNIIREITQLT